MIIKGKNLRLYYHQHNGTSSYIVNLPEIENEVYGFELTPGQSICAIRYTKSNEEYYFGCKVLEIADNGLLISEHYSGKEKYLPFVKQFHVPMSSENLMKCDLYIEPCDYLFEKNKLADILGGNIDKEDFKTSKFSINLGKGIWYKHGGWRTISNFEKNLSNFIKLGQLSLI